MSATIGQCRRCDQPNQLLVPLHGEKGGPLTCMSCGIDWHAEHGRRRKMGRIVTKAIKAYFNAGGAWADIDRLKLAASGIIFGSGEADTIGADVGDITTELLEAAIRLTHPDKHPPERREAANQVTQELVALKPFVFPAPKKAPPLSPSDSYSTAPRAPVKDPLRIEYPCELCVDTVPYYYCAMCKATWNSLLDKEREQRNAKQRKRYARRQTFRRGLIHTCAVCSGRFNGKRKDAKYCSASCRQQAHRERVTDKSRRAGGTSSSCHAGSYAP